MVLVKILPIANENRIGFCELTIRQSLLHHPPASPIAVLRKGGRMADSAVVFRKTFYNERTPR